jgi:NADH:ubiquinone oxidoreductase subunit 2 (subunit N)
MDPASALFFYSSTQDAIAFGNQPKGEESSSKFCNTKKANRDINFISEFKGLFFSNPLLSLSLAVSLFSMAGIPPLIGFFSKQLVLYSALQNGYYFISVLAIIVSVISCSYYLKLIKLLFSEPSLPQASLPIGHLVAEGLPYVRQGNTESDYIINLSNTHSYLISTLTFTILLFFIKPSLILNSTQLLSLSLFYI